MGMLSLDLPFTGQLKGKRHLLLDAGLLAVLIVVDAHQVLLERVHVRVAREDAAFSSERMMVNVSPSTRKVSDDESAPSTSAARRRSCQGPG